MNETRRGRLWRRVNSLAAGVVCWFKGHQDFGVAGGLDCLRCGRESRWDLRSLPPPRLKYAGDPEKHRLQQSPARGLFEPPPSCRSAFVYVVSEAPGDTYASATDDAKVLAAMTNQELVDHYRRKRLGSMLDIMRTKGIH
jgi:hypothetical protein